MRRMLRRIGRRRGDKVAFGLAIFGALAFVLYMAACEKEASGPTAPTPAVTFDPTVNQGTVTTPTPAASPEATPKPELPLWVSCDAATGICTFGTDKPRLVSAKCTEPAQDAPVYGTWDAVVNDGDTIDVRDICHKIEPNDCSPKTVPVQVDFQGMGRHLGHLGPLYSLTFPQKLDPEECEDCIEWKEPKVSIQCGDFNECHEHPQASGVAPPRQCFQEKECVETTTWNCKGPTEREYEETGECPCDCEEGGPYRGEQTWGEEVFEGQCPAQTTPPTEACHQKGTQEVTWDCQDPTSVDICRLVRCPCVPEWSDWRIVSSRSHTTECLPVPAFTALTRPQCEQTTTTVINFEKTERCTQEV